MQRWTILTLIASGALVALGVALSHGSGTPAVLSVPLLVIGVSASAVWVVLWGARTLGLGKHAVKARHDPQTFRTLAEELVNAARQAETRGVLTLADCRVGTCAELFRAGVGMVIAGEEAGAIRAKLHDWSHDDAVAADAAGRQTGVVCRICTAVALCGALAPVLWLCGAGVRAQQIGGLAAFGVLSAVYGAFAVAALAGEIAQRALTDVGRRQIEAALITDALIGIRSGHSADEVAAALTRLIEPGSGSQRQSQSLRRAA